MTQIVDRMVPPEANNVDEDERSDTPWWRCKKWATKILFRIFEKFVFFIISFVLYLDLTKFKPNR